MLIISFVCLFYYWYEIKDDGFDLYKTIVASIIFFSVLGQSYFYSNSLVGAIVSIISFFIWIVILKNYFSHKVMKSSNDLEQQLIQDQKKSFHLIYPIIDHSKKVTDKISAQKYDKLFNPSSFYDDSSSSNKEPAQNNIIVIEANLTNLFQSQKNINIEFRPFIKKFIGSNNYLDSYIKNNEIGKIGELLVIEYEKNLLIRNNKVALAKKINHTSLENDNAGYDILSFDLNGKPKYIEVKTSQGDLESNFFLTKNELNKIKETNNYFIYRIYDFDLNKQTGNLYIIECEKDFEKYFSFTPTLYSVKPNKKL